MRINLYVNRLLIAITTIITTAPAFASDGQLEINQACAINTGCFSGDAPGFPVTITTPGSYRLTGNLDLSTVSSSLGGIEVSAPAVMVNLGGFQIAGATTCSGSGATISCSPQNQSTGSVGVLFVASATAGVVQNGVVRNMASIGVYSLATGTRVQDITAIHNGWAGIGGSNGSQVVNSRVIENGVDGLDVIGGSVVDGVTAIGNGRHGINLHGGGGVVTSTVSQDNGRWGFKLSIGSKFGNNNLSIDNQDGDLCGGGICTERRRIYHTKAFHKGNSVLAACAAGFHTASISQLQHFGEYDYDNILGRAAPYNDPGPELTEGWALSGGNGSTITCNDWSSALSTDTGLAVLLTWDTNTTTISYTPSNLPQVRYVSCDSSRPVWCAEY